MLFRSKKNSQISAKLALPLTRFANFSSVGILVSGIGAMAPERKADLIKVSLKALIGATLASCMTGLVIGIFS